MPEERLVTLAGAGEFHLVEKKSEFIGYACPISSEKDALDFIASVREKNPDARHNVSAYVCGAAVHASDDGEPQGTGGVPVLDVIRKSGLDRTVIVVTRYFGGILLGAGGLVRAYSGAAAGAVRAAGIAEYEKFIECFFKCGYGDYKKLLYEAGRFRIISDGTEFGDGVTVRCAVYFEDYDALALKISDLTGGKVTVVRTGERFDTKK